MGGIAAVTARIADIQSRFGAMPFSGVARSAPGSGTGAAAGVGSFGQALEAALARTGAGGASAPGADMATKRAAGSYPKLTPPAELTRYGNGKIPADALRSVRGSGHRLWEPAAQSMERLLGDARAAGVKIDVTDSYRSFEAQEDVARRKGLYRNGGLAAVPGTSAHGWGMAVDLGLDPAAQRWMRDNGHKYGFVEDTPREPWHWTYRPDRLA